MDDPCPMKIIDLEVERDIAVATSRRFVTQAAAAAMAASSLADGDVAHICGFPDEAAAREYAKFCKRQAKRHAALAEKLTAKLERR